MCVRLIFVRFQRRVTITGYNSKRYPSTRFYGVRKRQRNRKTAEQCYYRCKILILTSSVRESDVMFSKVMRMSCDEIESTDQQIEPPISQSLDATRARVAVSDRLPQSLPVAALQRS